MKRATLIAALFVVGACVLSQAQVRDRYSEARRRMVQQAVVDSGVKNKRVIESMLVTKRHEFVPIVHRDRSYLDIALPIGEQQTISSPFIVAFMTESIDPQPGDRVLEIGTGSGYQVGSTESFGQGRLYTIEIVRAAGTTKATQTLSADLKYDNVHVSAKVGDGFARLAGTRSV